jgi:hypothetical protein
MTSRFTHPSGGIADSEDARSEDNSEIGSPCRESGNPGERSENFLAEQKNEALNVL